jgi:hypothetical protein
MRISDDFARAFERVAVYMLAILVGSVIGFTYAAIAGAVFAGPRGSLLAGIIGGLLAGWFAWRFIRDFSL